jgi:hypothetical protein
MFVDDLFNKKSLTESTGGGSPWYSESDQGVAEAGYKRDAYQRDYDNSVAGMGKRQSRAYQDDGGGNDERHDLDPTEWYIVKDGKMFKTSVYPNQEQQAISQGYSRSREEAKAKASDQGVAEGYQFKGPFPFDVDHMHGGRGINLPKAETKKYFTDKKQWQRAVDDINSSKYDDNSDYIGVTGRSTVEINGREWARWSDAQQKGYIEVSSMTEQGVGEGMLDNPGQEDSPVAQAIIRRILMQRTDLLAKHGPKKVGQAVDDVADFVGDVDEIGSSDVSGWVRHVEQMLGNMQQDVAEAHVRKGSIITESKTYKLWESAGQKLVEAQLTADQVNQIFQQVEQGATAAGGNRTMIGKGKDAAGAVSAAWEDLKTKVQNSGPIKGVDAMYDKAAAQLKQATGGDQGVMKYVQKYRDFAKKHPVAQSLIYSALIAAAGISGAGLGGAAALGLFKLVDKLLQGEKFSSAAYQGAKTGAMAYGASKLADYMKGNSGAGSGNDLGEYPDGTPKMPGDDVATQAQHGDYSMVKNVKDGENSVVGQWSDKGPTDTVGSDSYRAAQAAKDFEKLDKASLGQSMKMNPMLAQRAGVPGISGSEVSGTLSGITGDQMVNHPAYQAMIQKFGDTPGARQAAMSAAKAAIAKGQMNESIQLTESQLYLMIGKIVERQRKLDEGIMDTLKGAAGKAVDWAKTKGANLTTKITADKLLQAWKKAGSPTDSLDVAKVIQTAGVPSATIKQVYNNMKIPFAGEPGAQPAMTRKIDVDSKAASPAPTAASTAPATAATAATTQSGATPATPATPEPTATTPAQTPSKSGIQTGATALIDPDTKRPYEKDKLAAMYGYKEPVAEPEETPPAPAAQTPTAQTPTPAPVAQTPTPAPVAQTPAQIRAEKQKAAAATAQGQMAGIAPAPATQTPAATTAATTTNPAGFNAGNIMKLPGMEKYAKPAPAPKTANFGAGPTGYAKTTTSFKPPAAPSSPALAVPGVPKVPRVTSGGPTPAEKANLEKRLAAAAPAVAETMRQIDRMLESVTSKKSAEIIKAYADQRFTELGLRNTTECKQIMAHVVHESAVRRRAYAQRMAK